MDRLAITEFLELPTSATDEEIRKRALGKKDFFLQLQAHAPNMVLKNLYTRNVEKITEILKQTGGEQQHLHSSPLFPETSQKSNMSRDAPAAWLIRHTENMNTKSFPLYEGKTIVGREQFPGYTNILLENDPYLSRQHAVIEMVIQPVLKIFITDGLNKPSKNGVYINSHPNRITERTALSKNDTLQIGNTKLTLKLQDAYSDISQLEKEVTESEYMKTVIINLM